MESGLASLIKKKKFKYKFSRLFSTLLVVVWSIRRCLSLSQRRSSRRDSGSTVGRSIQTIDRGRSLDSFDQWEICKKWCVFPFSTHDKKRMRMCVVQIELGVDSHASKKTVCSLNGSSRYLNDKTNKPVIVTVIICQKIKWG